jgi:hypothetical protein
MPSTTTMTAITTTGKTIMTEHTEHRTQNTEHRTQRRYPETSSEKNQGQSDKAARPYAHINTSHTKGDTAPVTKHAHAGAHRSHLPNTRTNVTALATVA